MRLRTRSAARLPVLVPLVALALAQGAQPARADLVGYWPFDGNLDDASGRDLHGAAFAPLFEDDVPDPIGGGQSLALDGNGGVEIPADPALDSTTFTLSFFVLSRGQVAGFSRIASRGGDTFEVAAGNDQGENDILKYYAPANGWNTTFHFLPFEDWQHVAYVYDGVDLTIYADGDEVLPPSRATITPSGVLHIGNRWNGVEGFIGSLDDVSLFDEPLSQDEIIAIAEAGTDEFLDTFVPGQRPPPPPRDLSARAAPVGVELQWTDGDVDGYHVYRSEISGGPYERLTVEPIVASRYEDADIEVGVDYFYVVTAVGEFGESRTSREVTFRSAPPIDDPLEVLVAWWPLDGDLSDSSGARLHATDVGLPSFNADVPAVIGDGEALLVDGSSGITIPADPRLDSDVFTLAFFVRSAGQAIPFSRTSSRTADVFETAIGPGADGLDHIKYYSPANGWNETAGIAPLDEWAHVAYVASGIDLSVYVDGALVHGPVPFTSGPAGALRFGIRHNGVEGFVGAIDDIALFEAALPAADIAELASVGTAEYVGEIVVEPEPPLPPGGLVATAEDGVITLRWEASDDADGYRVHRSDVPGGPYDSLTDELLVPTEYVDDDVELGRRFYYVVTAENGNGASANSREASAFLPIPVDDPADALVGWWTFDETLEDESDSGLDGFHFAPVYDADVPAAIDDGASLFLDGLSGVEVPADPVLDSEAFTLSMFLLDRGQIAGFSRTTSREGDSFETAVGTGILGEQLKYYSPANGWNAIDFEVPLDTWLHVAWVSDGSELTVWVDGEIVHGPVPFTARPTGFLHIGDRWNAVEGFIGLLDDVALFRSALDAEAIRAIADGGVAALLGGVVPTAPRFVRGDADASGAINITDGIFILNFLFLGGGGPSCARAADADASGAINITDGIYVLNFLFLGGPAPAAPHPGCGTADGDRLDCASAHPGCVGA